jgi:aspartate kinase
MSQTEIIVQKYGGTSVGTIDKIKNVAKRLIKTKNEGKQVIAIVSAMGHTTDEMLGLLGQLTTKPDPREYDAFLSNGEDISATLVAMAVIDQGDKAVSLTGAQAGIFTEKTHRTSKILSIDPTRIQEELKHQKIIIITGFQGYNENGDITTIGRGGSDTSAVAVAAALKAKECEIYTDVDGVYTTDPRIVPEAKKLKEISYDEMLELASLGAQVLHPRSVETAKRHHLTIVVRDAHSDRPGTKVNAKDTAQQIEKSAPVTGVASDIQTAKITLLKLDDRPGIAAKLFGALAMEKVNVDVIVQSVHATAGKNDISFTVNDTDYDQAIEVCEKVAKELNADKVIGSKDVAKISIVGVGMISTSGIAAKMFETLSKEKINIEMISTSEIKISCIIDQKDANRAVKALHAAFELDKQ